MTTKEQGLPILKSTLCRTGNHVWVWATADTINQIRTTLTMSTFNHCDCGLYSWQDWQKELKSSDPAMS